MKPFIGFNPKLLFFLSHLIILSSSTSSSDPIQDFSEHDSLLWGTYRPNLYFGLRPRLPNSLMMGSIWFGVNDFSSFSKSRHACEQGDDLAGYGWKTHDGRTSGQHYVNDVLNNVRIESELLKVEGGAHGGSWGVRIRGERLNPAAPAKISMINYFGLDGLGTFQLENEEDDEGIEGPVKISGSTTQLGEFTIRVQDSPTNSRLQARNHASDFGEQMDRTQYLGIQMPAGTVWKAKESIITAINERVHGLIDKYTKENLPDPALTLSLPNEIRYGSNLYAVQKTYEAPFELEIFFDGDGAPKLDSISLSAGLAAASEAFNDRFEKSFPKIFSSEFTSDQQVMAKEMLSSMIGGIGYFYGSSIVDRNFAHDYDDDGLLLTGHTEETESGQRTRDPQLTEDRELFTATPSRSFFPRGFYWDEGFHLALIGAWDNDMSLEILRSWMNLIDRDGWVAREQILGEEARSKVPTEFQTQYSNHANPPTLTMAVTSYIKRLQRRQPGGAISDAELGLDVTSQQVMTGSVRPGERLLSDGVLAKGFLEKIYPKLKLHYEWFKETQIGQIREWGRESRSKSEGYRWRGRTQDHVLTSGIDDYPRGSPHPGELHLDLICWMGFFTRTMKQIAEYVGEEDDVMEYEKTYEAILANIDDLHWNEEKQMYCDVSVNENDESYHVCHKGYISLFPFFLGLLSPDSPRLGSILKDIRDPDGVWSEFGIRSLSLSDQFFGQGENYWRGPIWIPMNYMALCSLYNTYAKEAGPYQQLAAGIYSELRENVIKNVYKEWKRTGFTWEQYDPMNGEGRRSKPFTGWTSLVAMMMAEEYDM
ncbi:family 63 glycoside hydrolase [Melampsora larici-populina 98AG31]|uniref:Mannosyl-oligosaccharide glucosidase n=1 Tax=Melampsora larici-populina (strain 98AG31 / pathotype 3-4-7) TaxID=747676 RepID=F4RY79_MELLP|nr:family 63 glycoside hydrolase [Melampsora larici-populina 98AG31]EGG02629.1 family 63 glycoside hydrolase [Melampsora larici-populina 98AG31]